MTFYFKPPRGTITLQTLNQCVSERVKYLQQIESLPDLSSFEESVDFQYLTDGSAFDRTGHYMLRLLSLKDDNMHHVLMKFETMLFEKRLGCLEPFQIRVELKTVQRHLKEIERSSEPIKKYENFIKGLSYVCKQLTQQELANHAFSSTHTGYCEEYFLEVPFTTCLPLIKDRQVELKAGIALVPCGKWQQLLKCLFQTHLNFGLDQLRVSSCSEEAFYDSRIQSIAQTCTKTFKSCSFEGQSKSFLKSRDIDTQSRLFPPCMASLHKILRKRHRLTHNERFHYSLFLKDIGMPIEEAIDFWRGEYLQPHVGCSACSHSWQKDGKRYLYGIRHLYGLEGARRSYRTPCCKQLQRSLIKTNSEGGCPFVHYDDEKLLKCFNDEVCQRKDEIVSLLQINKTKGPQTACQRYLSLVQQVVHKTDVSDKEITGYDQFLTNPVRFYIHQMSRVQV